MKSCEKHSYIDTDPDNDAECPMCKLEASAEAGNDKELEEIKKELQTATHERSVFRSRVKELEGIISSVPGWAEGTREEAIAQVAIRACLEEAIPHLRRRFGERPQSNSPCPACGSWGGDYTLEDTKGHQPDCRGVRLLRSSLLALGYDLTRPDEWPYR